MQKTFINLPEEVEVAVATLVKKDDPQTLPVVSESLHERYLLREKGKSGTFVHSSVDALAYLGLRFPATYAQIAASLLAVQEQLPSWKPKSLLDIGSGPATGVIAACSVWPTIQTARCIEANQDFISFGKTILEQSTVPTAASWQQRDVVSGLGEDASYDVIILANVLNELDKSDRERLVHEAYRLCRGVMVIIEPGTEYGNTIIQSVASTFADTGVLLAPYIAGSFVANNNYWIHFPQRFIRPEFQRRIRQQMRDNSSMASDWEETKYSYVAVSTIPAEKQVWGRCIGPIKKYKGYLEVPVLNREKIQIVKVMKRHKKQYSYAKELHWGDCIWNVSDFFV